jgi:CTD nuclear envelope phosphatase 1
MVLRKELAQKREAQKKECAPAKTTWEVILQQKNVVSYLRSLPDWCFEANTDAAKKEKTLVIDLDGLLLHSSLHPPKRYDFLVEYHVDGAVCTHFIQLRPHTKRFLEMVNKWYTVYLYSASDEQYVSMIAEQLESRKKFFAGKLYRNDCDFINNTYVKDFRKITLDVRGLVVLDAGSVAYSNKLPMVPYLGDVPDDELLASLVLLDALRHCDDVRSVLSLAQM